MSREVVDSVVVPNRYEIAPLENVKYVAFVDPSGGSGDSMTLAIVHLENQRVILDLIRDRKPPFSPEAV